MKIYRSLTAVIAGFVLAGVAIMAVEMIDIVMFKPADAPGLENLGELMAWAKTLEKDSSKMNAWMKGLPTEAHLLVLAGWQIGAFLGGTVSALIAGRGRLLHAGIIGGLVLAGTIMNFISTKNQYDFSHPNWMVIAGLLLPLPMSLLAGKFVAWMLPLPPCCEQYMKANLAACALLLLFAASSQAEPLKAGAARIDITPPPGHPMWGYAIRRDAPSVGVRDPLQARAVVLTIGNSKIAIVSLDLGRAPTRQSVQNIRKQLKDAVQIDSIFLVASHTHHGPVLELDDWPTKENPYVRLLEEKIVKAITEAHKNLQPARLGISSHEVPFNRNRHSKRADRTVDKELILVRLDDAHGKPIVHLVNFAAHPTMLPAKLREFSHDYPGFLAQHVEKELGGVCLFLQGAAGDMSPNPPGEATPEKFGESLGKFVVEKSGKLKCDLADAKPFKTRERDFKFTSRIDIGNPLIYAAYSLAFFPSLVDFYEREYREGVRPHLSTALLDGRIGIVGVSGEFFSSHALQLKRRARLEHLLFLGYCNDYQQYFPTIEAVAEGGYGADTTVAPAEIGAGERVMDQALIDLLELQGKIRLPTPKKK